MHKYIYLKKTVVYTILAMILIVCCVGCSKDNSTTTEDEVKTITRTYSIAVDSVLTEEEINEIVEVISNRVSYYDVDGKVNLKDTDANGNPFIEISIAYGTDEEVFDRLTCQGKLYFISDYDTDEEKIWLGNENINKIEAKIVENMYTEYIVEIIFDKRGGEIFEECTTALTGEQLYIVYDDQVLLAPTIVEPVPDGVTIINNFESFEDAEEFAMTIESGTLEYKLDNVN